MPWLIFVNILIAAVALSPTLLTLRQSRATDAASRWRVAIVALVGLTVGTIAGGVSDSLGNSRCGDIIWGCMPWVFWTIVLGAPVAAIGSGAVLRSAGTPRPWLTGLACFGTSCAFLFASMALARPPGALVYVVCFVAGYLVAALAVGPVLASGLRLALYIVVVGAVAVDAAAYIPLHRGREAAEIERLHLDLVLPDVAGYELDRTHINQPDQLYVYLLPTATEHDYEHEITLLIMPMPAGFAPLANCDPGAFPVWAPCDRQVGPDVWHAAYGAAEYVVRRGNSLVIVQRAPSVDPELSLAAATTLRAVTAADLVVLS